MLASLVWALSVCMGVGSGDGGSREESSVRLMKVMVIGGVLVRMGAIVTFGGTALMVVFSNGMSASGGGCRIGTSWTIRLTSGTSSIGCSVTG